ncbi:hypothetical protein ACH5RR_021664 [Cinchona calisaya]|uniref:Uncharacterized protein n=1 Tax=Cinchona calisaya TaxID=153742 RepID=A0ABD2ZLH6_9GENT
MTEGGLSNPMNPNKQIVLKNHVTGYLKESDFEMRNSFISFEIPHGSKAVLLKNLYLACDPYMRHLLSSPDSEFASLLTPLPTGSVLIGYGVAKVIKSGDPTFNKGDYVWGKVGWEEYTLIHDAQLHMLFKIKYPNVPLSYYGSVLAMPGIAAYFGFHKICAPKEGEIVYVSSAAGGVGQLVGQFAKLTGCYVVGSVSTQEKVDILKSKLGFDDVFNYKDEPSLSATLKRLDLLEFDIAIVK